MMSASWLSDIDDPEMLDDWFTLFICHCLANRRIWEKRIEMAR